MVDLQERLEEVKEEYLGKVKLLEELSEKIKEFSFNPEGGFEEWKNVKNEINKKVKEAERLIISRDLAEARYYEIYWAMTGKTKEEIIEDGN